jgi:hypothetical protein
VVRREVRARTQKGYPISFTLMGIPRSFDTWEKAQFLANCLNYQLQSGQASDWLEEELAELD